MSMCIKKNPGIKVSLSLWELHIKFLYWGIFSHDIHVRALYCLRWSEFESWLKVLSWPCSALASSLLSVPSRQGKDSDIYKLSRLDVTKRPLQIHLFFVSEGQYADKQNGNQFTVGFVMLHHTVSDVNRVTDYNGTVVFSHVMLRRSHQV